MVVDPGRDGAHRLGGDGHLLGKGAGDHRAEDAVADRHSLHPVGHLGDPAHELAARDEGDRKGGLVLVGDQEDVGEVDGGGADPDPHLPVAEHR